MLQATAKTSGSLNQCLHKKFLNNEIPLLNKVVFFSPDSR
jgi:hypothetical protein